MISGRRQSGIARRSLPGGELVHLSLGTPTVLRWVPAISVEIGGDRRTFEIGTIMTQG
jgi:hypothetical protein